MNGRPWITLFLLLLWPLPLSAATVSVQILETGLVQGEGLNEYSVLWENSLLDQCFELGHIVSNAPMGLLRQQPPRGGLPPEARDAFEEAREGGAAYFILALLDFNGRGGKMARPRSVSLRIFRVPSGELLADQSYAGEAALSPRDEQARMDLTVRRLLAAIYN
jgi:hypothetical protein